MDNKVCQWRVTREGVKATCGDKASGTITIKGRLGAAEVHVCHRHQVEHNERAADLRVTVREERQRRASTHS